MQLLPDPPDAQSGNTCSSGVVVVERSGAIAQLGERLLCKQEVTGSIPVGSTNLVATPAASFARMCDHSRVSAEDIFD